MGRSLLLIFSVCFILSGCALWENKVAPATASPTTHAPTPGPSPAPTATAPPRLSLTKPPPPKPPPPTPDPTGPNSAPDELIGLDSDAVSKLLGNPTDTSNEGGARIQSYHSQDCVLDVIFFRDVKTGVDRVLSFDLHTPKSRRAKPCYEELRSGR